MLLAGCGSAFTSDTGAQASASSGTGAPALPPLTLTETGDTTASDTTAAPEPEGPALCEPGCHIALPLDWRHEAPSIAHVSAPDAHRVPAMLHHDDGSLTIAEQHDGSATLHHLDADGRRVWKVGLPLPCDNCELSSLALHPSGDLLLGATGMLLDRGFALIASRYDPRAHATVWTTTRALERYEGTYPRSGAIAALGDSLVVQLYVAAVLDFQPIHSVRLLAFGESGLIIEDEELRTQPAAERWEPLLSAVTPGNELALGLYDDGGLHGLLGRVTPPLWNNQNMIEVPMALDALRIDDRDHAIELGHAFDGSQLHMVLQDRAELDPMPRWVSTLALPSTVEGHGALALGPDREPYVAFRIAPAPGPTPVPLVGTALTRWTTSGELRWQTTLLAEVADSPQPLAIAVDEDEGLLIAAIVGDHLRVERRTQACVCEEEGS